MLHAIYLQIECSASECSICRRNAEKYMLATQYTRYTYLRKRERGKKEITVTAHMHCTETIFKLHRHHCHLHSQKSIKYRFPLSHPLHTASAILVLTFYSCRNEIAYAIQSIAILDTELSAPCVTVCERECRGCAFE